MPEERKTIESRLSASPEVYQHTKFMARFEKAFPWLLAGGAALVLLETYRKNTNDRAKANADFKAALKNQEHQAEVLKERKAERRERYTKAVEQLGNEKAPVRMGGVYTLIGLVDEWLEEKNLEYSERLKEGQVIINNLCAYIRSPFTLASYYDELSEDAPSSEGFYKDNQQKFYTDKAALKSEADIRLSIIKEIHSRLQSPDKNTPGPWSDFEYDFSGSTFFYPIDLTKSYYTKPVNFSGSTYQDEVRFDGSVYKDEADFGSSIYKSWATFDGSTYTGWVGFNCSTYQSWADFSDSTYQDGATFMSSTYQSWADFRNSAYQGRAGFTDSTYQSEVYFNDSTYQWAHFSGSTYRGWADFRNSAYQGRAGFTDSIYQNEVYFSGSTYEDKADFSGSIFCGDVYYGKDRYNSNFSRFTECTPQFYNENSHQNTLFGSPNNNFIVDTDKGYPINLNSEGLPLGCDFLTADQKEYLEDKFQEIDETKNKFREVKDTEGNAILVNTPLSLNGEIRVWREKVTTVKAEDNTAPKKEDN